MILKKAKSDIDGLSGQITEFGKELDEINDELTGFKGQITDFNGKFTGFEGQITDFSGKLTGFEGQITDFSGRMDNFITSGYLEDNKFICEDNLNNFDIVTNDSLTIRLCGYTTTEQVKG